MELTVNSMPDRSEITFEEGVIGVPRAKRFVLLSEPDSAIMLLRSLDIPGFVLPVSDPRLADPAYCPRLGPHVADAVGADHDTPLLLLAVTALDSDGPTVNLRAPLVIQPERRRGIQVILDDRDLPLRAPMANVTPATRSVAIEAARPSDPGEAGQEVPDARSHP